MKTIEPNITISPEPKKKKINFCQWGNKYFLGTNVFAKKRDFPKT